jgi:tetratricopeptide (TPR) repeat protein
MAAHNSQFAKQPSVVRNLLGRILIVVGLSLLVLWPLRPSIATVVYNNVGSVLLNRALLAPDVGPEEQMDRATQAGQSFQTALAWNSLNGHAYYNLSTLYDSWHDTSSASRALSRAAALNPHDISARFRFGQALAAQGYKNEKRAIQEWRAAGATEYFIQQGLVLASTGDLSGAVEQYGRALAIEPDFADGYYYLGRALSRMGRQEEALAALEMAAVLEPPSSPRRYLLRAEVYVAREEWEAALAAFGQAASLSPWDPVPYYQMGWVLDQKLGDRELAITTFQQALQINPDYVSPRLALGQLYEEQGECDQASLWLAPLLSPNAGVERAGQTYTLLGHCLLQQGRADEGLWRLEQALALNPDSVPYTLTLAQGYSQAGRYHDAIELYLRVLELQPDNVQAQQSLEELGWFGQ